MTITITWDWFSFITGIFASVVFMFLLLVVLAYKQWSAKKKAEQTASEMWWKGLEDWGKEAKGKSTK